ncbi:GNAT family N-acetyltransferase [Polyangium sp. 6x1]|uniref:GNAT family N-acetyltransferase n=1 Tax=Polyangium sp. 6x1 TaxID=3042689 RepID=UPI002482AA3F|nr:GNAT family N-acetyltransferase [Polyangium sp. 6x1]MDI1451093.1 GNAT family N-acetyltransferase [Polyangium sp. 6x1]
MDLDIRPLKDTDPGALHEASRVLHEAFGSGYPEERLARLIQEPARLILSARLDAHIVCVGMAVRLGDDLRLFASFGEEALARLRRHRVGLLDSMAVASGLRAKGIGQRVAHELMAWLIEGGCDLAVAASWVSGGPNPSQPGLEKLGFQAIAEQPGEDHRIRNLGGRPCPVCGIPCRCSGILFVRSLSSTRA